ncbi:MAG: hypothetical protein ACYS8S_07100, partial [Planctomycetota bacterium]
MKSSNKSFLLRSFNVHSDTQFDQRLLPERVEILCCKTPSELFEAIKTLAVRGAPAIGVAGAYGICLAVCSLTSETISEALTVVRDNCGYLSSSRPTAVNLFWALDRMQKTAADFIAVNP